MTDTPDANGWYTMESAPEHVVVDTKIHDADGARNHAKLRREGPLWFFPDGSMYVYYTPTHWRPVQEEGE